MGEGQRERLLRALWIAVGLALVLRLLVMAWMPLIDPAEGRYAEIGRKMAALGDWITPWHADGVPFWGKPPLSFWLTAASFKLLGVGEFSARLPHFLCGVATAACIWNVARRRSAAEGAITVAILSCALLFFLSSGAVMTDAALVLGTTMATGGAWLALVADSDAQRRRQAWVAFVGAAVGILAKGPLALVLIGTPLLLWALWCGRLKALWQALPWFKGLLLVALLTLPWFWLAERKTPGFFEYFIVGEHFHRFLTPGWSGDLYGKAHHEPKGMIWVFTAGAMAPWTLVLPVLTLWRRWDRTPAVAPAAGSTPEAPRYGPWAISGPEESRLVMLWALTPVLFFTASSNIIWTYVLPAMPALAWWAARWMAQKPQQGLRWAVWGAALSLAALLLTAVAAERMGRFERGSAKGLMQTCDQARQRLQPEGAPSGPRLILLGRRSFSAVFYAQGQALRVDRLEDAFEQWPSAGTCLAVQAADVASLQSAGVELVEDLGTRHERRLWWARRPAHPGGSGS